MAFHNPYHFVPVKCGESSKDLSIDDFKKGNVAHVTHDRYTIGDYSGRILCQLTAESPFVVGDKHNSDKNKKNPTIVYQYEFDEKPAIPASTIRGLVSSLIESASNSSLKVLNNEIYSYRKKVENPLTKIGILIQPDKDQYKFQIKPFSYKKILKFEKPAEEQLESFSFDKPKYFYAAKRQISENNTQNDEKKNRLIDLIQEDLDSSKTISGYERGILRVMQDGNRDLATRKHEIFIICDEKLEDLKSGELEVSEDAVSRFNLLAKLRNDEEENLPYYPIGTRAIEPEKLKKQLKLKAGDIVYYRDVDNTVIEVSFSSIWRDLIGKESNDGLKQIHTTFDFFGKFEELLPFNEKRKNITLAEQMFGFVQNDVGICEEDKEIQNTKLSLAGRVYPSVARLSNSNTVNPYECDSKNITSWKTLKILANPKPPSPAMYFKDSKAKFISKEDLNASEHEPQGRKFYLHNRQKEAFVSLEEDSEKVHLKMKVNPVKKGTKLFFHIDFENLSKLELGALLYSLEPSSDFRHKIGLGKPIGLGSVKIEKVAVFFIARETRYKSESLFGQRYSTIWKKPEFDFETLPDFYSAELQSLDNENAEIDEIYKLFQEGINYDIRKAIEDIGNATMLQYKVHYPKIITNTDEEENFKWFVANEDAKQNLKPIGYKLPQTSISSISKSGVKIESAPIIFNAKPNEVESDFPSLKELEEKVND